MKRFLCALVMMVSASVAQAAAPVAAKNFVDGVAKQVIEVAGNEGLAQSDKQAKIEAIFTDKVDINFIAKFVMGKNWRIASPQQQQDYVAAYKPFILKTYASKLARYSGQAYTLKNARADGDATVVTMEINDTDGKKVLVDYRLKGDGDHFRIVDIAVEGVSLLTTQRSEFASIIENKGIDGLIDALKKQVAAKG